MKHLAKILNLEKYKILVEGNNVIRGSLLPLLGENELSGMQDAFRYDLMP